jgi:L-2-hydroxyglutarate oxidase LhgO
MHSTDCVVVGAGVIGLAVARELAMHGREVLVLESETSFGMGVSSRNSEVIHAGIYYPKDSLRALMCVSGRRKLYDFCAAYDVDHRRCGKFIVATSQAQIDDLRRIRTAAAGNGVELDWLEPDDVAQLEPAISCVAALSSPNTGIIDTHGYMLALIGQAEQHGATLAYGTRVRRGWVESTGISLALNDDTEPTLRASVLINCAALGAVALAGALDGFPAEHVPALHISKGNYFSLNGRAPFTRLVYPVPEPGGLGIHLTLDLGGRARFGPDVEAIATLDYQVDPRRGERFYDSVRKYWPKLPDNALAPAFCGIRPRIYPAGGVAADFRIDGPRLHSVPNVINLFGIESPGLTSSLAISEYVAGLCDEIQG